VIRPVEAPGYGILSRRLLHQHLVPFAAAFVTLTAVMVFHQVVKRLPSLRASGATSPAIFKVFVLTVPFITAATLPMAVLVAVLHVFTSRSGNREILTLQRLGVTPMRLVAVVLAGATILSGLALLWDGQVVPRSNHELRTLLVEIQRPETSTFSEQEYRGDRELSIGELRRVAKSAADEASQAAAEGNHAMEQAALQRAATYAVEIQKKYAISVACLVFALFGAALGLRIRGGGWPLVLAVSTAVFVTQYVGLIAGEELGDRLIVSPFFAMWTVNLVLTIVGCGLLWSIDRSVGVGRSEPVPPA
jgi:lipopolysaccharide export LptBFGC system permease protein LptF